MVAVYLVWFPAFVGIGMSLFVRVVSMSLPMCRKVELVHEELMYLVTVPKYRKTEHFYEESEDNERMECT